MIHVFDTDVAQKYGVNAAIILQNIGYWIKQNEANGTNFYDGRYWTFNSKRAYGELFPYMSKRQIETAFQKLIEDGVIVTGCYNKLAYDRTLWYALTQKGKCILHFDIMENDALQNGNSGNVTPIPNINTDVKPNENTYKIIIAYLNEKANKDFKAKSKATQQHINARLKEGFTVDDFKTVIDKKCAEWLGTDFEQYLRPATLFGTKFEGYLNARSTKQTKQKYDLKGGVNL